MRCIACLFFTPKAFSDQKFKMNSMRNAELYQSDCTGGRLDPMSSAFIQMSGVFAELELGMIRERVKSGMANAKAKGVLTFL